MSGGSLERSEYELLDAGEGRRLERFGDQVVDRPDPAASGPVHDPSAWSLCHLRFDRPPFGDRGGGHWTATAGEAPTAWLLRDAGLTFELRPTPTGQVGFFAEQREPWRWLRETVCAAGEADDVRARPGPPSVLNLFAYTGGSTLIAAAAGARVTHVDAARSAVAWARRNADASGLADAPVRWIVDDAMAFVRREARRARRYRGLVLDPPSHGHGPRGERWSLEDRLPSLLDAGLALLEDGGFVLLTAHAQGLEAQILGDALAAALGRAGRRPLTTDISSAPLLLEARSGARLAAGVSARWVPS